MSDSELWTVQRQAFSVGVGVFGGVLGVGRHGTDVMLGFALFLIVAAILIPSVVASARFLTNGGAR
jgi:hypothetical protein